MLLPDREARAVHAAAEACKSLCGRARRLGDRIGFRSAPVDLLFIPAVLTWLQSCLLLSVIVDRRHNASIGSALHAPGFFQSSSWPSSPPPPSEGYCQLVRPTIATAIRAAATTTAAVRQPEVVGRLGDMSRALQCSWERGSKVRAAARLIDHDHIECKPWNATELALSKSDSNTLSWPLSSEHLLKN